MAHVQQARDLVASLIGSRTDEVAFTSNTAAGVTIVAEGIQWRDGDNIVVPANEFPSNLFPWLTLRDRGVEVRTVVTQPDEETCYRHRESMRPENSSYRL